ncbi:MAG: hypothetical protein QW813_02940 [Candidatus Aenigmatarchaeota archaeon]
MYTTKKVTQLRKLERKGNEYLFRVHRLWIENYLKLKEGDLVDITIERPKTLIPPITVLKLFKKYFPELKKFSFKKLGLCFSYLRIEKSLWPLYTSKKLEKIIQNYENKIKKKMGKKFLEDYKLFKKVIPNIERLRLVKREAAKKDKKLREELKIGEAVAKFYGCKI